MKTRHTIRMTAAAMLILLSCSVFAKSRLGATSAIGVGVKMHANHSEFTDLPYDDGDLSYAISYEAHMQDCFYQFAVEYAFDVNGVTTTDMVLTPQVNLLWKDGPWYGGFGILASYIDDEVSGDDWTDIYYQLQLGVKIPFFKSPIDLGVYYPMEKLDDIGDFDFEDLNYGAWLSFSF